MNHKINILSSEQVLNNDLRERLNHLYKQLRHFLVFTEEASNNMFELRCLYDKHGLSCKTDEQELYSLYDKITCLCDELSILLFDK
jgi:hypothetical protein